jgi:hypothetical protein
MKREVVLGLSLVVWMSSHAAAQDFEFTLDEVDAANAPSKGVKRKPAPAAAPAADAGKAIQQELGEVRWGMSKADVLKVLKAQIRAEFEQRIKVERDIMRQDALYQEAQDRARRLSGDYVAFDGQKTGWDVSPIRGEFTHGNRETMLVVAQRTTRDMYFFIQGRLWKWYREYSPQALQVNDAGEALAVLQSRFGAGKPQQDRVSDAEAAHQGTTWTDGSTRVTALRRGADACLILEDQRTIDQLAVLRHSVQPKNGKRGSAAVIDSILLSGAELEARNR